MRRSRIKSPPSLFPFLVVVVVALALRSAPSCEAALASAAATTTTTTTLAGAASSSHSSAPLASFLPVPSGLVSQGVFVSGCVIFVLFFFGCERTRERGRKGKNSPSL